MFYAASVGTDSKSLSPERMAAARAFAQGFVDSRHAGNVTAAAQVLKVSQAYLRDFVKGVGGVGMKLLEALADAENVTVDVVIGRSANPMSDAAPARERALWRLRGALDERVVAHVMSLHDAGQSETQWLTIATSRQRDFEDGVLVFAPVAVAAKPTLSIVTAATPVLLAPPKPRDPKVTDEMGPAPFLPPRKLPEPIVATHPPKVQGETPPADHPKPAVEKKKPKPKK